MAIRFCAHALSAMLVCSVAHAFTPASLAIAPRAKLGMHKGFRKCAVPSLRMQAVPPGWQKLKDEASGREYYYNAQQGVTQWEAPAMGAAPAEKSARDVAMEKVLERQRIQDADKVKRGALALESNRAAVILATLFIGLPVLALVVGWGTGVIPNPFEVCTEGGTSC